MDEEREENSQTELHETAPTPQKNGWLMAAVIVLIVGLCVVVAHSYVQGRTAERNSSREAQMSATMGQLQGQIDSLNTKLSALAAQQTTPSPAPVVTPAEHPAASAANRAAAHRRVIAESRRYKQLQTELADQKKELKNTQDQLAQTRSDLEGNINSTRDQLNGSIAKNHDELVALEQKGERSYYEFDLTKSKQFSHEGPLMISLRKADTKHKSYDLAMIVDDNQMNKKHVNLYEPIWIDGGDSQEVQVVVNQIDKNHIHGYVSAPKYPQSARLTPAAAQSNNGNAPAASMVPAGSSSGDNSSHTTQPTQ